MRCLNTSGCFEAYLAKPAPFISVPRVLSAGRESGSASLFNARRCSSLVFVLAMLFIIVFSYIPHIHH